MWVLLCVCVCVSYLSIRKSCKVHTKLTPEREGGTTESVTRPQTWNLLSDVTCNKHSQIYTYTVHTLELYQMLSWSNVKDLWCMHISTLPPQVRHIELPHGEVWSTASMLYNLITVTPTRTTPFSRKKELPWVGLNPRHSAFQAERSSY